MSRFSDSKEYNFSKSFIQFFVDVRGGVPSLLFALRPNYGGGNEDNGDLLQKVPCTHPAFSAPDPCLCQRLLDLRFTEHGPAHQNKTQFPLQSVSPIRKLPLASYPYPSEGRQNENHNHRKLIQLITWTIALYNSMKL